MNDAARPAPNGRRALRIGIDARAAVLAGEGGSRVACELLRALARGTERHRYVLYTRDAGTSRWTSASAGA